MMMSAVDAQLEVNAKWRRVTDLPFQRLDDETLIVDPAERKAYLLNETASRVWELCALPRTIDDLVAGLESDYDVPAAQLRREVTALINHFLDNHLLEST